MTTRWRGGGRQAEILFSLCVWHVSHCGLFGFQSPCGPVRRQRARVLLAMFSASYPKAFRHPAGCLSIMRCMARFWIWTQERSPFSQKKKKTTKTVQNSIDTPSSISTETDLRGVSFHFGLKTLPPFISSPPFTCKSLIIRHLMRLQNWPGGLFTK